MSKLLETSTNVMGKQSLLQRLYNKHSRRNEHSDVYLKVFTCWVFYCSAGMLNMKVFVIFFKDFAAEVILFI